MNGEWHAEPWLGVRVAGLPADVLAGLQLTRSSRMADRLEREHERLAARARECAADLFGAINGCDDVLQRRLLLTLKRRLYGGKPIAPVLADNPLAERLPTAIQAALADIAESEAAVARVSSRYASVYDEEILGLETALRDRVVDRDWLGEVLLSSSDLWQAAQWIKRAPSGVPVSTRQRRHESALARYMFRAATRTVPFGGLAAVALVCLEDPADCVPVTPDAVPGCPSRQTHWHRTATVHLQTLQQWLRRRLTDASAGGLLLRVPPVIKVGPGAPPVATFPVSGPWERGPYLAQRAASGRGVVESIPIGPLMQEVLAVAGGNSAHAACELLARSAEERGVWRQLVDSMVQTGLLTRDLPPISPDYAGLVKLSRLLERLGDAESSSQVLQIAQLVADFPQAEAEKKAEYLLRLSRTLHSKPGIVPLYADTTLHGLTREGLGVGLRDLREIVRPALAHAQAVQSDEPHRWLCRSYLKRFGPDGVCRDVPALLVDLLQDGRLMSNLRRISAPPPWVNSSLGKAIAAAGQDRLSLDASLFSRPGTPDGSCSLAAFVQLDAPGPRALRAGDYRVVLNGVQSGRYKYLSRYLGGGDSEALRALADVRAKFVSPTGPVPVEIMPVLGLNFQVHPRLTSWILEIPGEPTPDPERTLPLSDLTLRFDGPTSELRIASTRLGRDIELIHLGFLRDLSLPDQLLLIRALSPRISEDTVSERAMIYDVLDRTDAARRHPLRPYRPRLEVGRLVMERARWAVPLTEVPVPSPHESGAAFFARLTRWRRDSGLPARGFVRRLLSGRVATTPPGPPQYLDFSNPFTIPVLQRLATEGNHRPEPGWLVMRELLPSPENATLQVNGRSHVSELLVQFEWEQAVG